MTDNKLFMTKALELAEEAYRADEVPVGAIIVKEDTIIGKGRNRVEELNNASAHAELIAISEAAKSINNWRLDGCSIYVTLEPCLMCLGAILNSRISSVVFGAYEPVSGALGSKYTLTDQIEVIGGVLETESKELIQQFFREKRQQKLE